MEGSGSVQIISDPDTGGPKTNGSGSGILLLSLQGQEQAFVNRYDPYKL